MAGGEADVGGRDGRQLALRGLPSSPPEQKELPSGDPPPAAAEVNGGCCHPTYVARVGERHGAEWRSGGGAEGREGARGVVVEAEQIHVPSGPATPPPQATQRTMRTPSVSPGCAACPSPPAASCVTSAVAAPPVYPAAPAASAAAAARTTVTCAGDKERGTRGRQLRTDEAFDRAAGSSALRLGFGGGPQGSGAFRPD